MRKKKITYPFARTVVIVARDHLAVGHAVAVAVPRLAGIDIRLGDPCDAGGVWRRLLRRGALVSAFRLRLERRELCREVLFEVCEACQGIQRHEAAPEREVLAFWREAVGRKRERCGAFGRRVVCELLAQPRVQAALVLEQVNVEAANVPVDGVVRGHGEGEFFLAHRHGAL